MNPDPASLSNLQDIVMPSLLSWWPPALGIVILAIGMVALMVVAFARGIVRYRANAYRRVAERELAAMAANDNDIAEVAGVLKRTALVAYPRETVAPLSGQPWLVFLDRTGRGTNFSNGTGRNLPNFTYGVSANPDAAERRELIAQARRWVRTHRGSAAQPNEPSP